MAVSWIYFFEIVNSCHESGGYVSVKGFPDIEDAMIGTDDDYSEAHG